MMARSRWSKDNDRAMAEILARFDARKGHVPFAGLSPEELEAKRNLPFDQWLRAFLPDQFLAPDAPFHLEADRRMQIVGTPVGQCWFGGAGKTWRYTIAKGVYRIVHGVYICKLRDGSFVALPTHEACDPTRLDIVSKRKITLRVIGARNLDKAAEKTRLIRALLAHSPELRAAYGDEIVPVEGDNAENDFTVKGVRTVALGIQSDLRGVVQEAGARVQDIDLADIENNEIAASKEREDKITDQIFTGWLARCEQAGEEACLAMQMNQYRSRYCQARAWKAAAAEVDPDTCKHKAIFHVVALDDGEFHSNWPGNYSDARCKSIHFKYGSLRYNIEFRCREVNDDSKINPEWFKVFHVNRLAASEIAGMTIVAALDPNHKAEATNDYAAWVVMGRKRGTRAPKYLLHAWLKKATPTEIVEEQWAIEDAFPTVRICMEDEAIFAFYGDTYFRMCNEKKPPRPPRKIFGIHHSGNKVDRILTDWGEIQRGEWHVDQAEGQQALVIDQYAELPKKGVHDDGADAAEMSSAGLDELCRGEEPEAPQLPDRQAAMQAAGVDTWLDVRNEMLWQEVA